METTNSEAFKKHKDFLVRKSHCKIVREKYLDELRKILLCDVSDEIFLSLEMTDKLRDPNAHQPYEKFEHDCFKKEFLFSNKQQLKFYLEKLQALNNEKLYVLTDYSQYCGAVEIKHIGHFNFKFEVHDEHAGTIIFLARSGIDRLMLDSNEENGEYYIEVEAQGKNWSKVNLT